MLTALSLEARDSSQRCGFDGPCRTQAELGLRESLCVVEQSPGTEVTLEQGSQLMPWEEWVLWAQPILGHQDT